MKVIVKVSHIDEETTHQVKSLLPPATPFSPFFTFVYDTKGGLGVEEELSMKRWRKKVNNWHTTLTRERDEGKGRGEKKIDIDTQYLNNLSKRQL